MLGLLAFHRTCCAGDACVDGYRPACPDSQTPAVPKASLSSPNSFKHLSIGSNAVRPDRHPICSPCSLTPEVLPETRSFPLVLCMMHTLRLEDARPSPPRADPVRQRFQTGPLGHNEVNEVGRVWSTCWHPWRKRPSSVSTGEDAARRRVWAESPAGNVARLTCGPWTSSVQGRET